jgi:hypothetical protein
MATGVGCFLDGVGLGLETIRGLDDKLDAIVSGKQQLLARPATALLPRARAAPQLKVCVLSPRLFSDNHTLKKNAKTLAASWHGRCHLLCVVAAPRCAVEPNAIAVSNACMWVPGLVQA